ncbi:MAG: Mth938-like domain-containing protein [Pseudomonadota bacterium]
MSDAKNASEAKTDAFFPGRAPIDAYGNGGFRFAEMSHKGAILCLPNGIFAWAQVMDPANLSAPDFQRVFEASNQIEFLLLGTGQHQVFPSPDLRQAFEDRSIGLEPMSTGSAARTYNVLLAEGRAVAAALIAVD